MKQKTFSREVGEKGARKIYGVKVLNLPKCGKQKLTPSWVRRMKEFISKDDEKITLHTLDGDIVFSIDHPPGRYCLTCDEELPDNREDPFAKMCRAHVAEHGEEAKKTERWPPGYMVANSFECTIEDKRNG